MFKDNNNSASPPSSSSYNIRSRPGIHNHKIKHVKYGLNSDKFDDYHQKSKVNYNNINRRPYERTSCSENIQQYLLNSTLHGLRYVGERDISIIERIFFILSFILVMLLSGYYITNVWEKWSGSPVIITLNSRATSINDIPFPAVTICNMNQAKKSKVMHIKGGTVDDMLLHSLCSQDDGDGFSSNGTLRGANGKWSQFRDFVMNVAQPCSEMLLLCRFASQEHNCRTMFETTLTDEGVCCTFNSVATKFLLQKYNETIDDLDGMQSQDFTLEAADWTPETGYPADIAKNRIYPRPTSSAGSNMGLFVILNTAADDYYCSTTNCIGFKILLHNPTEAPKISEYGMSIGPGEETRIVITPKISDASSLIRRVPIYQRQCIFANEGNLSYFRTYTRKNCEMECESRIVEEYCGCVLYFMPRTKPDTNICNRKDWECYGKIKFAIDSSLNNTYQCKCLPGCFEMSYSSEISSAQLNFDNYLVREQFLLTMDRKFIKKNIILLYIYPMESFFRSYTKEELIGFTEFLSNTGGLLGLFMGFSVVSLIEIIYYLSLRPYCAKKRYTHFMSPKNATTTVKQKRDTNKNNVFQVPLVNFNNNNQYNINDYKESFNGDDKTKPKITSTILTFIQDKFARIKIKISSLYKSQYNNNNNKKPTDIIIISNNDINSPIKNIHYPYVD